MIFSLAKHSALDRHVKAEVATEDIVHYLKERFLESQGFVHKVEERLAYWAWSRGRRSMSEQQLLQSIDPDTRKCAFRRVIRIKNGLT